MRTASALCLLLLSGCAAGMQQPQDSILRPTPRTLRINGTFEPETFAVGHPKRVIAYVQKPYESILGTQPKVLQINGTTEPVTFVVDGKRATVVSAARAACQTNDPMPTGRFEQPAPPMPHARPLRVAPMPNACPVTVPMTGKSVLISAPRPSRIVPVPVPVPTEPKP